MTRPSEIERREVYHSVPREGVADLAIERIRLVLIEAQDVWLGFAAGHLTPNACDACTDEDSASHVELARLNPCAKRLKSGGQESEKIPRSRWASEGHGSTVCCAYEFYVHPHTLPCRYIALPEFFRADGYASTHN